MGSLLAGSLVSISVFQIGVPPLGPGSLNQKPKNQAYKFCLAFQHKNQSIIDRDVQAKRKGNVRSYRRQRDRDEGEWKLNQASDASEGDADHIIDQEDDELLSDDAEAILEHGTPTAKESLAIERILASRPVKAEGQVKAGGQVSDIQTDTDDDSQFSNSDDESSFASRRSVTPAPQLHLSFQARSSRYQNPGKVSSPHLPSAGAGAEIGPAPRSYLPAGTSPCQRVGDLSSPRLSSAGSAGLRTPTPGPSAEIGSATRSHPLAGSSPYRYPSELSSPRLFSTGSVGPRTPTLVANTEIERPGSSQLRNSLYTSAPDVTLSQLFRGDTASPYRVPEEDENSVGLSGLTPSPFSPQVNFGGVLLAPTNSDRGTPAPSTMVVITEAVHSPPTSPRISIAPTHPRSTASLPPLQMPATTNIYETSTVKGIVEHISCVQNELHTFDTESGRQLLNILYRRLVVISARLVIEEFYDKHNERITLKQLGYPQPVRHLIRRTLKSIDVEEAMNEAFRGHMSLTNVDTLCNEFRGALNFAIAYSPDSA
ncbi:hypothetical protein BDN72DRAFT_865844 [Pluteus cervinus]|uniref:Uncharacterized protein n=1 Tax=Pluteus cervinus TaxID=181527 RepID=A0ACD2ZYN5_9AGAR|nr:hypothetical protein BDN72DRAFT_865844 [Pluteus cervinus]